MALSNAQKQRRHRERVKARLQSIEAAQAHKFHGLLVALGRLLSRLSDQPLPEGHEGDGVRVTALMAAQAWLEVATSSEIEILPPDDVGRISLLATDLQKKFGTELHRRPLTPARFTPREWDVLPPTDFTPRELNVISRLRHGKPNRLIAEELEISEGTVKIFIRRIMQKLAVRNRTQAALLLRDLPVANELADKP